MQKESVERTEGHYTHEHVISKLCISNLQLHVLQLHLQIKRSPWAHKSAIQAFQVQDLWISGLPKARLYKLKKNQFSHSRHFSRPESEEGGGFVSTERYWNWEWDEEVGQRGWRGLTFVMGEEVMSEGGGRACVAVAGAQRGAELQHSCQPLREEEQWSRTKEKRGRKEHTWAEEEGKKLRRKRKARKGHARPKGDLAHPYTLLESYGGRIWIISFDSPGLWKCWGDFERGGM